MTDDEKRTKKRLDLARNDEIIERRGSALRNKIQLKTVFVRALAPNLHDMWVVEALITAAHPERIEKLHGQFKVAITNGHYKELKKHGAAIIECRTNKPYECPAKPEFKH